MTFDEFLDQWLSGAAFLPATTSGSTGKPKEIYIPREMMEKSARRTLNFFNLDSDSRLHSCVAADFIGGKMMAVRAQIAGARFSWETPSNRPLQGFLPNEKIDLLAIVPSQMLYILENLSKMPILSNIIVGGSPIPRTLRQKIASTSLNVYETYGMTETASHIALRKITSEPQPFKTLPGISVSADSTGGLIIYLEGCKPIKTNDIAQVISPEEFFILGRKDHVIISGGRKINPVEVEEKISEIISRNFCIIGVADEKWGSKVILVIESKPFGEDDENLLNQKLREALEKWEIPKEIRYIEKLPLTNKWKIDRPSCQRILNNETIGVILKGEEEGKQRGERRPEA